MYIFVTFKNNVPMVIGGERAREIVRQNRRNQHDWDFPLNRRKLDRWFRLSISWLMLVV